MSIQGNQFEPETDEEVELLEANDIGEYKGKSVRLLFPADPFPGWIGVELIGEMGGKRRTGKRVYIEDVSKFGKLVLRGPRPKRYEPEPFDPNRPPHLLAKDLLKRIEDRLWQSGIGIGFGPDSYADAEKLIRQLVMR